MIQNAKAFRLSNTRAVIWWEQTTALEVYYKVICKMCNSTNCNQTCPKSVRFKENNTSISNRNSSYITGLERGREYLFIILGKIETIDENHWRETSKRVQLRGTNIRKSKFIDKLLNTQHITAFYCCCFLLVLQSRLLLHAWVRFNELVMIRNNCMINMFIFGLYLSMSRINLKSYLFSNSGCLIVYEISVILECNLPRAR